MAIQNVLVAMGMIMDGMDSEIWGVAAEGISPQELSLLTRLLLLAAGTRPSAMSFCEHCTVHLGVLGC